MTNILEGAAYTTDQKNIDGYTFEKTEGDAVSGTMDSDKVVTYVYSKIPEPVYYTLTVNYVDLEKNPIAEQIVVTNILEGAAYTTDQKNIDGYTFERTEGDAVSGTMDSDKVVTYVYSKNAPVVPPVEPEQPPVEPEQPPVEPEQPPVEPEQPPVEPEQPPVEPEEPPVEPEEPPVVPVVVVIYCDLTVNYVDEDGNVLADQITEREQMGTLYTTEELAIEGYTFEYVEGDAASGIMDSDKVVTYVYSKNAPVEPEIPVEPPVEPSEPPVEPEQPPVEPEIPEEPIDIPDEEVPLADVPSTGDFSAVWMALTGISAAGLVGLGVTRKKKED